MTRIKYIFLIVVSVLLVACTSDTSEVSPDRGPSLLTPLGWGNVLPQDGSSTRSEFEVGENTYIPYNQMYPLPINLDYTTIGAFLASSDKDSYTSIAGYFRYKEDNSWNTTVGIKEGDFFIFGYMPSNLGDLSAKIDKRVVNDEKQDWDKGAVLTLKNLSTVTPADVCVVVGVLKAAVTHQDGDPSKPLNSVSGIDDNPTDPDGHNLTQGVYAYQGTEKDNYVYLLLDHIYANVNLEFCVDPNYAELRTIKLKQVLMKAKSVKETIDLEVELSDDDKAPIKDIRYAKDFQSGGDVNASIFSKSTAEALEISHDAANPTSIPAYFTPGMTTQSFEFEFHYDVYDKKGNIVREDCIAINKWSLPGTGVKNGKSFKVKANVIPTYLYQLSEPDLDNPTIELDRTPAPDPDPAP